jgi:hypothetical protein
VKHLALAKLNKCLSPFDARTGSSFGKKLCPLPIFQAGTTTEQLIKNFNQRAIFAVEVSYYRRFSPI